MFRAAVSAFSLNSAAPFHFCASRLGELLSKLANHQQTALATRNHPSSSTSNMFSPEGSAQPRAVGSLRNPRRRRRQDSENLRQPRKRSKITEETFVPNDEPVNGHLEKNGYANGDVDGNTSSLMHMPVREKRVASASWRTSRSDGGTVLVRAAIA
jgi:hypothetical protein